MNRIVVARELVKLAKSLMGLGEGNVFVSVFSFDDGKPYSEGRYMFSNEPAALRAAKDYMGEGYDVVVWQGDTLIAFSVSHFTTLAAMKYGTGTVNRLTKERDHVMRLS